MRSTSCETVGWHGIIQRGDKSLRDKNAGCPPCTIKVSFTKSHSGLSLAECKLIHIYMTMNLGEFPYTWIAMSSLVTSKINSLSGGFLAGHSDFYSWGLFCMSELPEWLFLCKCMCLGHGPLFLAMGKGSRTFHLFLLLFATGIVLNPGKGRLSSPSGIK